MSGYRYSQEQKNTIRKYAGIKSAEEIALMIGKRPENVHTQGKKLGVSLRVKIGEKHHNAKLTNLQVEMINALSISGFRVVEIHKAAFNHVAYDTIFAVVAAYNRKTK
jgi:hypothetical protein|tara:strand:+ start:202 stop:525 length:324 start_codon:yes stop_codon:yes gene_type:complete